MEHAQALTLVNRCAHTEYYSTRSAIPITCASRRRGLRGRIVDLPLGDDSARVYPGHLIWGEGLGDFTVKIDQTAGLGS